MAQLTIGNFVKTRTDSCCMLITPAMHLKTSPNNRHQLATCSMLSPQYGRHTLSACRFVSTPQRSSRTVNLPDCWKINCHSSNQSPGGPGGSGQGGGGGRGGEGNRNHDREDGGAEELLKRFDKLFEEAEKLTVGSILSKWMKRRKDVPTYVEHLEFVHMMFYLTKTRLDDNLASIKGASFIWFLIRKLCNDLYQRILQDDQFTRKLIFQFVASAGSSLWCEFEGRRKKSEKLDYSILASALTTAVTQSFVVWLLAPASYCYWPVWWESSGPNNVFEENTLVYKFGVGQRMLCLIRSGVKLFMLGTLVKAAEVVVNGDEGLNRSASIIFGNGMFFGFDCNLRYQILCGLDRMMVDYFGHTKFALALCAIFRASNA